MTTEPTKRNYWETSPVVNDLILLKAFIRKNVWVFLFVCATIFVVSSFLYQKHTAYVSKITFLVNSSNMAEMLWNHGAEAPIELSNDDRGYNRINQIIYSSQMIDYLIEKFSLYKHYSVDPKLEVAYLGVSNRIKDNIKIGISKTKIITVQVSDRLDYNVAANMANAIGKKINDINRRITVESLTRKTEIFESLSKDLRASSQREFSQMDSLMKNLKRFISGSVKDEAYKELLMVHLTNMESKSEDYFKNLFESYKYRLYAMYSLQEKNLPTISVLEKALPDKKSKTEYSIVFYPLMLVFSILVPLFFTYMLMKVKPVAAYVLRNSPGEPRK